MKRIKLAKLEREAKKYIKELGEDELFKLRRAGYLWKDTQETLRKYYSILLKDRCKKCDECCCGSCHGIYEREDADGYFKFKDATLFVINGWKLPKETGRPEGFLSKIGCTLDKHRRSRTCLLFFSYRCEDSVDESLDRTLIRWLGEVWDGYMFHCSKTKMYNYKYRFTIERLLSIIKKRIKELELIGGVR